MLISVITPTYNRAYILHQAYQSLKDQTYKNFEWIIVDDGSTDNTQKRVQLFIDDNILNILYIKQENGGKHRAHNIAVKHAKGELIVCLDSDDALSVNALQRSIDLWAERSNDETIGILARRGNFKDHKAICSELPLHLEYATMSDLRDKYKFKGDTILFFRSALLKKYLFNEFCNENFMSENNLYVELDKHGKMILSNDILYYCNYLEDGLTSRFHQLLYKNPKGAADTYYKMAIFSKSITAALKYSIIAHVYLSLVKNKDELIFDNKRGLMMIGKICVPLFLHRILRP